MKSRRLIALLLATVLCLSMFAGCSKKDEPTTDPTTPPEDTTTEGATGPDGRVMTKDQIYRTMYSGEVTTMNYLIVGDTNNLAVAANTIDTLVEFDSLGNILPSLATEWTTSEDGLTWTFKIREGAKWYDKDGNEMGDVTANDWVAAIKHVLTAEFDSSSTYLVDGWLKNAGEYYEYTSSLLPAEDGTITALPEVKFEDVGVKAEDDYTLVYTLDHPRPYFLTALSFGCYFPAYAPLIEELGINYALDNESMYFNGAFLLKTFEPQNKRVYVKNANYWDAEHVYINEIRETYNSEAGKLAPEMFLRNEIDYADIDTNLIKDWKADPEKTKQVAPSRTTGDYSYFFTMNFEPRFDEMYEPKNWTIAVNNENFRHAIYSGLDRMRALQVEYPENAESLLQNAVTPNEFAFGDNGSYVNYGDLKPLTDGDYFDEAKAKDYAAKAKEEIVKAGGKLPVIIPLTYNTSMDTWGQQCIVIKQQLEALLGADFIQVEVVAGPATGFLAEIRRAGKYGLMMCNWGADYADPETWTDPFVMGNSYNFAYDTTEKLEVNNKTPETMKLLEEYFALVETAKAETSDIEKRYELFAKAEAFYINHAFALPFSISGGSYQASRMNVFEGQYAVFGLARQRYKGQHVYETGMGWEAFETQLQTWKDAKNAGK